MEQNNKISKKLEKLKTVIVALDLSEKVARRLRVAAAFEGLSPQDQLRKMVGLNYKKPQRPRITLGLRDEDYKILAKRYNLTSVDKNQIKKQVMDEITNSFQE